MEGRGMSSRSAEPGELCTCGRQAIEVFEFESGRAVGYCGLGDGGSRTGPCPFCGAGAKHLDSWGYPAPCPRYRVRPVAAVAPDEFLGRCALCGDELHLDAAGWPVDESGSWCCQPAGDGHVLYGGER